MMKMKITKETKTFLVSDYRDNPYPQNQGIYITAGHGDGLYDMGVEELRELRDLVDWILHQLVMEKKL